MDIKDQFPIFKNNPELIYLDNAATTQKPQRVIDALLDYYSKYNSNVHRGLYPLSAKSTDMYEAARKTIADFINAEPEEIIFTSGTTDGINAIIQSLLLSKMVSEDSTILTTELEHHSSMLPLRRINSKQTELLEFDTQAFELQVAKMDKFSVNVLATTLVSNVTGNIIPVKNIIEKFKPEFTIIDAAQAVAHIPVDVKTLGADFVVFSGHKMYGPTGVGVIWGKKELLKKLEPFRVGGGMITLVDRENAEWAELPEKFEAGTPPIADAIALAEAANFLSELGFAEIEQHEQQLRKYLIENLQQIPEVKIYHPALTQNAVGVVSFTVGSKATNNEIHPHDIAQFLGDQNICVRAGHHCTQILHREVLKIPASLRVSLGVYNTTQDIDKLIAALKNSIATYQKS